MINLAGRKDCDEYIKDELERACISIITVPISEGEIRYTLKGSLGYGMITFSRAWYYWIAEGKVPRSIAEEIYSHPEGKKTVRIGGHCGCMAPNDYGLQWLDKATGKVIIPKDQYDKSLELCKAEFVNDKYEVDVGQPKEQFATIYHIDDQAGLMLFAMKMNEYYNFLTLKSFLKSDVLEL